MIKWRGEASGIWITIRLKGKVYRAVVRPAMMFGSR